MTWYGMVCGAVHLGFLAGKDGLGRAGVPVDEKVDKVGKSSGPYIPDEDTGMWCLLSRVHRSSVTH
jgi:hypothetical protein